MGEVINYFFDRQREVEQLNERGQEVVRFLCSDYPNDENQLQRNMEFTAKRMNIKYMIL